MGKKYITAYVETEVDVNLEDFQIEDLCEFLEEKGFTIYEKSDMSNFNHSISKLYSIWRTCDGKVFEKDLCEFFSKYLNKDITP